MVDAAQSTISGYLTGEKSSAFEEERQKRNAREEAVKAKQKRIADYRGSIDPSKPLGGQQGYLGLAAEDPQAAKQTADVYTPVFEQHKKQLGNAWRTTRALPPEQMATQSQGLIASAVRMGVTDEATADQLSNMARDDPQSFARVMDQMFEINKTGRKETERDRKIADLRDRGFSRQEAVDLVDRYVQSVTDPLTGEQSLLNRATQELTPVGDDAGQALPTTEPAPETGRTMFDYLEIGVGAGPMFKEFAGKTLGQIAPGTVDPEVVRARTSFRTLGGKMTRAFASSSRPLAIEAKELFNLVDIQGLLQSPEDARARLTEVHSQISRQLMDDLAYGNDKGNPKKIRQDSLERARNLANILREIGDPEAAGEITTVTTQEEYDALPSGAEFIEDGKRYKKP